MRTVIAAVVCGLIVFVSLIAQDGPETVVRGTKQFRQSEVVTGLAGPFEVTWGPDNMLWVTERTGKRITRVNPATGEKKVAVTIDEVSAPGGQDGLMGLALDLDNNFVYTGYTYVDTSLPPHETRGPKSPYRFLYTKIVRLTYDRAKETLSNPVTLVAALPAGNDHQAGRMKIGPDRKLYYTIGDQGNDQLGNYCVPIESQRLPTQAEIQAKNYVSYVGKALRLNLDGSIPNDNPQIEGVRSHVFTYGHRNPQGIDFGPDGTLYESEHGPKTDDEINILRAGANYGWPHVAGMKDDKAYQYARWAEATTPCASDQIQRPGDSPFGAARAGVRVHETVHRTDRDDVYGADRVQLQRSGVQRHRLHLLADGGRVEHRILRGSPQWRHPRLGESTAGGDVEARLAIRGRAQRRWAARARAIFALLPIGQPLSRYCCKSGRQDDLHRDRSLGPGRGDGGRHYAHDDKQGIDSRVYLHGRRDWCGG